MADQAKEAPVLTHIEQLVAEEHRLFDIVAIQVELQCWDLLRQRRALRETGRDESAAQLRPPAIVEKYVG